MITLGHRRRQTVLLLQLDGSLPNIALMRIAHHHRSQGDQVEFHAVHGSRSTMSLKGKPYDQIYASLIFEKTRYLAEEVKQAFPTAIMGGTGWSEEVTLESHGISTVGPLDYSIYPRYRHSIGFAQRGCRLNCSFCKVPRTEGRVNSFRPIAAIYRGEPFPKNVVLLDNDFFGSPEWKERIQELIAGGYRVNFCQGINARFLTAETAGAIASVDYFNSKFTKRRLYTAWDNRRDEERLFAGLNHLKAAGVRPGRIMVYVLVGYNHLLGAGRPAITEDDVYRVEQLRRWGADPYPMPFVRNKETIGFQRWVCRHAVKKVSWDEYKSLNFDSR